MSTSTISPGQKVLRYIQEHDLIAGGQKVVVAVSGGPDSVCLLHILSILRQTLDIQLHIAHLNHQLRGPESAADADYVAEIARKFGIPATIESRDVKTYQARKRLSPEEAAREVRYAFLGEVAEKVRADKVAVGHTADDHIETILMHLLRGSGTGGLRGLLPLTSLLISGKKLTIVRPLLELTRNETVSYCRRHRLNPRLDTSNLSPRPFRNRIRLELLPELQKYNPKVREALMRMARISADDLDFIEKEAERRWSEVAKTEKGSVVLDRKKLNALPAALKRHLLRSAVETVLGNLKDIEAKHIEEMLDALDKPAGKVIGLPDELSFIIEYDRYVLTKHVASLCPFPTLEKEVELKIPGRTILNGWKIEADLISPAEYTRTPTADKYSATFDLAKTGKILTIRHPLPGDSFQPLGMDKPKRLNGFMIDARIPRTWRERIPIVASPDRIIWVAGYRIDERVKVTEKTETVLLLKLNAI